MSDKDNFFNRLKNEEHRGFEITMFSVSVCVAVIMLISVIMVLIYWHKANADKISDEEVNATNVTVTEAAVTEAAVTVTEKPNEVTTGAAVITENDFDDDDDVDDELKEATHAYTTTKVNMRANGSLTSDVVAKVPAGEKVKIIELTEDHKWMKVSYNGETGYISVMYLTTTKPVVTPTPAAETAAPRRTPAPATTTATPKPTKKPKPKKTPKPTKKPTVTEEPETDEPEVTEAPATAVPTEVPATEAPTAAPTEAPTEAPATAAPAEEETGE